MAYCVLTCKKPKSGAAGGGLSAHIDRQKWDEKEHKMVPFVPKSVIHPELAHLNKEYLLPAGMGRSEAIEKRIKEASITRKIRADQAKFLAFVCSSDHETMQKIYDEGRFDEWVAANISFMQKTFGRENVVGCAAHMDELSYHLHITVVPIVMGQAAARPDTKKQYEERQGKKKRRYKKQEVVTRLCAKDVFTPANAERWQTEYALHMQAAGFNLERGVQGSQAKHVDPAVHNAIMAEEAKLIAEKDGLKMQKEMLEDEVETLQTEKQSLVVDIEALHREKKQTEKAVKGLETMCNNLTIQKEQFSSELTRIQNRLVEGKMSLSDFNQQKSNIEKQIADCDTKLADKQAKLEAKNAELKAITDRVKYYDARHVSFDVPEVEVPIPEITTRPPHFSGVDDWMKKENARIREEVRSSFQIYGKTIMEAAKKSIADERKFILKLQDNLSGAGESLRMQIYLRRQQAKDVLGLLDLFKNPDTAKLIQTIAAGLMSGQYYNVPCGGGGSVSSEEGWDGRKKNEDDDSYHLRSLLHAAKVIKSARHAPKVRRGYGR